MNFNQALEQDGTPSKSTMDRDIKSGKLPAEKDEQGHWQFTDDALESTYGVDLAKKPKGDFRLPPDIGETRSSDVWQSHPERGLTPSRAASILREMETGYLWNGADLYDSMLERDPKINSLFQIRKTQVLAKGWDILPNPGIEGKQKVNAARKQADWIKEKLEKLSETKLVGADAHKYLSFNNLLAYEMEGIGRGFSTAHLPEWIQDDGWYPSYAEKIHQRHFRIGNPTAIKFDPYELRLMTDDNKNDGEVLPKYLYMTHYDTSRSSYLTRAGLFLPSVWYYLFKYHGAKWFVRFVEIAATGMRVAKYDPDSSTREQDIAALTKGLKLMGDAGYGVIPKNAEIEIKELARAAGNVPQLQLTDWCDKALTELWLGQTGTTKESPGSLGGKDEQQDVQFDIMQADAIALMDTVQRSLIVPMAEFTDGEVLCYFDIPYKPEEDLKQIVDTLQVVHEMGVPIPTAYIYERTGIPEPSQTDIDKGKVTKAAANPFGFSKRHLEKKALGRTD